jgi:hypothetical protein
VHPYVNMLIAEQRAADMRAAAAEHRRARAATASGGIWARAAGHVKAQRSRSAGDRLAAAASLSSAASSVSAEPAGARSARDTVQERAGSMAALSGRGGTPQAHSAMAQLSRSDDCDAQLCRAAGG